MTKKIIIVYSGARHQGGIEKYLSNLFSLYDRKKMQLILVSLGSWPLCEEVSKAKGKVVVLSGGRVAPQNILKIKAVADKERVSLIASQGVVANAYARSAAMLANLPHLATVHSDLDLDYSNHVIRSIYGTSDKVARWKTGRYIAVSEYLKKQLIKSGVRSDRVTVIYNGVKLEDRKQNNSTTEQRGGEIIIGSMGRLHKAKGYENLIEAFSMIDSTGLKMVIWGEGKERKNLEALVKKLGLEEKVELPGFVDSVDALSSVDVYIQPSLSEGFGLGVVEAMLAGKPIIATPRGSLKEIVSKEAGIIAAGTSPKSLAEAMKKALSNPAMFAELGQNARKEAKERFSVDKWIRATEKIYLEMAK